MAAGNGLHLWSDPVRMANAIFPVGRIDSCLRRVSQTNFTPSNPALFARLALPAHGLDWISLARPGPDKQIPLRLARQC
jgi:hypothetical protein